MGDSFKRFPASDKIRVALLAGGFLLALALLLAPGALRRGLHALPEVFSRHEESLRLAAPESDADADALSIALRQRNVVHVASANVLDALRAGNGDIALLPAPMLDEDTLVLGVAGKRLVHLVAPADSAINSFAMLAGKRIGVGPRGATEESIAALLLEATPLDPKPQLVTGHNLDLEQAFLDGEIDAALMLRAVGSPDMTALMATGYYRLLPLPAPASLVWKLEGAEAAAIATQNYPVPGDAIIPMDVPTVAVPLLLVTTEALSGSAAKALALDLALESARAGEAYRAMHPTWKWHPAAEAAMAEASPATGELVADARYFVAGLAILLVLARLALRGRGDGESHPEEFRALLRRALDLEIAWLRGGDPSEKENVRRELLALEEEGGRAWRAGRITAAELLLLRLGGAGAMPERTLEELEAWRDAVAADAPDAAPKHGVRESFLTRAAAAAARSRSDAAPTALPARETPAPVVRVRTISRDDDFEPLEPEEVVLSPVAPAPAPVLPAPRAPEWDTPKEVRTEFRTPDPDPPRYSLPPRPAEDEFAPDIEEEEASRVSRFTAYTPIDTLESSDEFGSGALLNTIRIRRGDSDDKPEDAVEPPVAPLAEPAPGASVPATPPAAPVPDAPAPAPAAAAHAPQKAPAPRAPQEKAQKRAQKAPAQSARKAAKSPQAKPAQGKAAPQKPAAPQERKDDTPETGSLF